MVGGGLQENEDREDGWMWWQLCNPRGIHGDPSMHGIQAISFNRETGKQKERAPETSQQEMSYLLGRIP